MDRIKIYVLFVDEADEVGRGFRMSVSKKVFFCFVSIMFLLLYICLMLCYRSPRRPCRTLKEAFNAVGREDEGKGFAEGDRNAERYFVIGCVFSLRRVRSFLIVADCFSMQVG